MKITLYAVMTLDGKIAQHDQDSLSWASAEDQSFLLGELERFQFTFVGRKTYEVSREIYREKTCVMFSRSAETLIERSPHLFVSPLESFDPQAWGARVGAERAALLGGSHIYSYFLQRGWVDELYLTLEPLVFGQGTSWLSPRGVDEFNRYFQLSEVRRLNDRGTLLLRYQRLHLATS